MIETLIAASTAVTTIVTVSCADINTLVDRAKVYPDLSAEDRQEIVNLYYDFGEKYGKIWKIALFAFTEPHGKIDL